MPYVRLNCLDITDWDTFHRVFASTFGFPPHYGRTMDAWIDCMTDLNVADGFTTLVLEHPASLPVEIHAALLEGAAFVNGRKIEAGQSPVFMIASLRT